MEIKLWKGQKKFFMSEKMFVYLICGRGFGKSFVVAVKAFHEAFVHKRPCIVIAPTFKQLHLSIFGELKRILEQTPVKWSFNSQFNSFDIEGTPIYGFTAANNNYESVRGVSAATLFLDEAREYEKIVMDTAIPCLRGYGKPRIYVSSSPKGMNWLGIEVKRRLKEHDPDFELITATSYDNHSLDDSFYQMMEKNLQGDFLRQELYGEIIDSDMEDTLFGYTLLEQATSKSREKDVSADDTAIIGLDCARFGDDTTCGVLRIGTQVVAMKRLGKTDTGQAVDMVKQLAMVCQGHHVRLDCVCVDAAYGGGVIDMLRTLKYNVHEVNFSERSPNDNYFNMRAFMYFKCKEWIEQGGHFTDENLREELSSQRYFIRSDKSFALLPKEVLKKNINRSPDASDALALTFYAPAINNGSTILKKRYMDDMETIRRLSALKLKSRAKSFSF